MAKIHFFPVLTLIFLLFLSFLAGSARNPVFYYDDAINAECAREMLERGDWVVPTFNDELRTDKPPLHYYFIMLAYRLFGVNSFAVHFFSILFSFLTAFLVFQITRHYLDEMTALWAAVILIASKSYFATLSMATPDSYFIFFLSAAFFSFLRAYTDKNQRWLYGFYTALGLATMAKGPVALLLAGLSISLFLILKKEMSFAGFRFLKPLMGAGIIALITMPWLIAVTIQTNGQWPREFFLHHNLSRYLTTLHGSGGPWGLTLVYTILGFLPFSVFLIQTFFQGWKKRGNDLILFSGTVAVTVVLFFSFSQTQLPNYTLPAYPFFALLTGFWIQQNAGIPRPRLKKIGILASLMIYLICSIYVPAKIYRTLRTLDYVSPPENILLTLPYALPLLFFLLGLFFLYNGRWKTFMGILSVSWIAVNLFYISAFLPILSRHEMVQATLPKINKALPIVAYRGFKPAYLFYLKQKIPVFQELAALKKFLEEHPQAYVMTNGEEYKELKGIKNLRVVEIKKQFLDMPGEDVLLRAT